MKKLNDILKGVSSVSILGEREKEIASVHFDSRQVKSDTIFVAIVGANLDGHNYIATAIEKGASVIVCQELPTTIIADITYVRVADTNIALAIMAANYYDHPSRDVTLIGVTGTNGKTTIATLLAQQFKNAGFVIGLLSTVKIIVGDKEYTATHTTPDALSINKYLAEMRDMGVGYCFMEVSSHGIAQKRTHGLYFKGGIFTNLSHDHLDYHETFAEYRDVKKAFFDQLPKEAFALVNTDDKNGFVMLQNTKAKKVTYALKTYADYSGQVLENQFSGLLMKINNDEVWTKLIGDFNAYNLLAIFAIGDLFGIEKTENLRLMSLLHSVGGRFQHTKSQKEQITAIVDYAHTPDALENVLGTINNIRTGNEQLITVVGCGGDRDTAKRPIMAKIAAELSTQVIFTSDNPRTEDPELILKDMEAGVAPHNYRKTSTVSDRFNAIKMACQMAKPQDIILIAGKGHENYQEINGVRSHFDDFEIVTELLTKLEK